jgi:hypothetical protein
VQVEIILIFACNIADTCPEVGRRSRVNSTSEHAVAVSPVSHWRTGGVTRPGGGYRFGMPHKPRVSRVLDEHRFHALATEGAHQQSGLGALLLDVDLRIRGVNDTYEGLSMRQRDELLGEDVFDVFPDDPNDPQASGSSQFAASVESAMRRRGTDTMPIVRYDITDPAHPDVFLPRLWTCTNTAVDDGHGQIAVIHRVTEIVSLDAALSALSQTVADGAGLGTAEQLHVLSALAAKVRADRDSAQAMAEEIGHLRRGLETRDIIGQAKGMLMERFDVDAAAAFDLLVTLSQQSNTPLAVIARRLVEIDHPST